MLHGFLTGTDLIDRCRSKVAQRSSPTATDDELEHRAPLFLDHLIKTLRVEQTSVPMRSRKVSGPSGGGTPVLSEIGASAAQRGRELLERGFTVLGPRAGASTQPHPSYGLTGSLARDVTPNHRGDPRRPTFAV
jgi:hypothetical protein